MIFKNVVHSSEPGETPSNSASHQSSKLCSTFLNVANHLTTVRFGCGSVAVIFFNLLKLSTVAVIICIDVTMRQ